MHAGGKGGVQFACAEGDGLQGFVAIPKSTADVRTQIAGVLHGDLVPGLQLAVGHGVGGEALAGEPVVEGTHPAGALGGGLLLDAVDLADVAGVRTGLGIAPAVSASTMQLIMEESSWSVTHSSTSIPSQGAPSASAQVVFSTVTWT